MMYYDIPSLKINKHLKKTMVYRLLIFWVSAYFLLAILSFREDIQFRKARRVMTCIYPQKKRCLKCISAFKYGHFEYPLSMLDFGGVIHWVKYHSINMRAHGCSQDSSILRSA